MPRHQSVWSTTAEMPACGPLEQNLHVDVCIVGGGIAGLSTAYELQRRGKRIALLDDGPLGGGMTAMTSGHLTNMLDDRYFELEKVRGTEAIRQAADSHSAAIAWDTGPCVLFPRQGRFHPLKYLAGIARAIVQRGGQIFCASHADAFEGGVPKLVHGGRHVVSADAVVVATNVPVNNTFAIHGKQAPYMTYIVAAPVPAGGVADVLAWDTGDPYHYIRLHGDLLMVGGEDHKSGQAADSPQRYRRLEAWARSRFPTMGEVAFEWGGQVMEPADYLGFIGRNPMDDENVYVVTGDSGMGLTHGAIAGMLLADLVTGRKNPWEELYSPSRVPIRAAGEMALEDLNMAVQYGDWLTGGDVGSAAEIAPDSGAIVRRGFEKLAVYKDPAGALHERLAAAGA
jgi:glycine/D-amino acid oxidase-like deaminating enzyme